MIGEISYFSLIRVFTISKFIISILPYFNIIYLIIIKIRLTATLGVLVHIIIKCLKANEFDKSSKDRKTLMKKFSKWLVVSNGYCRCASNNLQKHASDLDNVAVIAVPIESKSSEVGPSMDLCNSLNFKCFKVLSICT